MVPRIYRFYWREVCKKVQWRKALQILTGLWGGHNRGQGPHCETQRVGETQTLLQPGHRGKKIYISQQKYSKTSEPRLWRTILIVFQLKTDLAWAELRHCFGQPWTSRWQRGSSPSVCSDTPSSKGTNAQTRSSRLSREEARTRGSVTASLAAFPDAAPHRKKGSSFFTAPKWDLHFPKPHPQGHLTFLALLAWKNSLLELSEETPAPQLQIECSGAARRIRQVLPSPSLPNFLTPNTRISPEAPKNSSHEC